jgi:NAD(P)-dependent dehydrogenase (short-subunit alcohol dehydrogenase family)
MTTTRDLAGKIALIIGGTRNQGAEFAKNIAARGATTIVTYRGDEHAAKQTLAVLEQSGASAEAIQSDATSSVDVDRLFADVVARHGRLDIVVHTPGAVIKKPIIEFTTTTSTTSSISTPAAPSTRCAPPPGTSPTTAATSCSPRPSSPS